jgi:hypothetical protein
MSALVGSRKVRREAFIAADRMLREDPSWPRPACEREDYDRLIAKPVLAGGVADLDVLVHGCADESA